MTKTTNYQLPKWEKTDRIQMKDFNDMTATLDEALHGLAVSAEAAQAAVDSEAAARAAAITALENKSRYTKLGEWVPAANANRFEVSLAGINWAQWDKVHLDMITTNGTQGNLYLIHTGGTSNSLGKISSSYPNWFRRLTLFPGFRTNAQADAFFGSFVSVGSTYENLIKINLDAKVSPSARFVLWGEK